MELYLKTETLAPKQKLEIGVQLYYNRSMRNAYEVDKSNRPINLVINADNNLAICATG